MGSDQPGVCDFCGKSIPGPDFRSGRAVVLLKKTYCHDCMQSTLQQSKTRRRVADARVTAEDLRPSVEAPRPIALGEHACSLFGSEKERRGRMLAFVRDGLRRGERVCYAIDDAAPGRILRELEQDDLDVERLRGNGQLDVRPASELYAPAGRFEAGETISRLRGLVDRALADGFPGLRLAAEMTWALRGWPGSETLPDYEREANQLFPAVRCAALCQYDLTRFALPHLHALKASHPVVLGALRS
jgi:hypothetical protein